MNEQALLQAAQAEGLLPRNAKNATLDQPEASWVVTAVSLIGAQFAVWPFLALLAIFGHRLFFEPPGSFVMSALLIGVAVLGLRKKNGHFLEHLCFTALLVGLGLLAFRSLNLMFVLVAAVEIAVALVIRVAWVQRLLGFMAALLLMLVYFGPQDNDYFMRWMFPSIWNATAMALLWCAWCVLEPRWSAAQPAVSRKISALADGLGLALLCFALMTSGSAFFGQGLFDGPTRTGSADLVSAGTAQLFHFSPQVLLQLALVLVSCAFLVRRWDLLQPGKRRDLALLCAVYAGLLLFGFFTHDGGVVVLVGTLALATGRRRLLALAVLVLLAQLSGFYYALGWPLVKKAAVLVVAGAVLAVFLALLRYHYRQPTASGAVAGKTSRTRWATGLIAASAVLSLGAINYDVAKKEQVISTGQKIYIRIVPRDPRSLMQGDYMALNFDFPADIRSALDQPDQASRATQDPKRALVVAKLDERGIATVLRLAAGSTESLASGELLLPLKHISGNWVVVTDAFFFAEGKGGGLRTASFGEFRVLPDGRALLVGLADENLQAMEGK
ncbi:MAG: GDYXXLXY domain-containing protein [Pseudomonadota bacterium]